MKLTRRQLDILIEGLLLEEESKLKKAKTAISDFKAGGGVKGAREKNIKKRIDKQTQSAYEKQFGDIDRKREKEKEQQDFDTVMEDLKSRYDNLDDTKPGYFKDASEIYYDSLRAYKSIRFEKEHKYDVNKKAAKALEFALTVGINTLRIETVRSIQAVSKSKNYTDKDGNVVKNPDLEYTSKLSVKWAESRIESLKQYLERLKKIVESDDGLELMKTPEIYAKQIERIDLSPLKGDSSESAAEKPTSQRQQQFDLENKGGAQIDAYVEELEAASSKFAEEIQTDRIFADFEETIEENIYRLAEAPVRLKNRYKLISLMSEDMSEDIKWIPNIQIEVDIQKLRTSSEIKFTLDKSTRKDNELNAKSKKKAEVVLKKIKAAGDDAYDTLARLLQRYTEVKLPAKIFGAIEKIYYTPLSAVIAQAFKIYTAPKYDDDTIKRAQSYYIMIFDLYEELDRLDAIIEKSFDDDRIEGQVEQVGSLEQGAKAAIKELEAKYVGEALIKQAQAKEKAANKKKAADDKSKKIAALKKNWSSLRDFQTQRAPTINVASMTMSLTASGWPTYYVFTANEYEMQSPKGIATSPSGLAKLLGTTEKTILPDKDGASKPGLFTAEQTAFIYYPEQNQLMIDTMVGDYIISNVFLTDDAKSLIHRK